MPLTIHWSFGDIEARYNPENATVEIRVSGTTVPGLIVSMDQWKRFLDKVSTGRYDLALPVR